MSRSHLFTLLKSLCETLATCAHIEQKTKPGSHEFKKAREVREATEPLAISCLDEEIADSIHTGRAVMLSGSILLIKHLSCISDRATYLSQYDWKSLLGCIEPATLKEMLSLGLRPSAAILPVLSATPEHPEWTDILLDQITRQMPLEALEIDELLRLAREAPQLTPNIAKIMQIQVACFRPIISDEVAKPPNGVAGAEIAALSILAGLTVADITPKLGPVTYDIKAMLEEISSHHGMLAFHKVCGSTEDFLKDSSGWWAWLSKIKG